MKRDTKMDTKMKTKGGTKRETQRDTKSETKKETNMETKKGHEQQLAEFSWRSLRHNRCRAGVGGSPL